MLRLVNLCNNTVWSGLTMEEVEEKIKELGLEPGQYSIEDM